MSLPIEIAGLPPMRVDFRIVPKLNHGCILGMEWFACWNPEIDWTRRSISLTVDGKSAVIEGAST